jgi:hypothetical protein
MTPGTPGGLRPSVTRAVRRRPGPILIVRRPAPRRAWATNAHRAGRGGPHRGRVAVRAPIGKGHRPDRRAKASPEFEARPTTTRWGRMSTPVSFHSRGEREGEGRHSARCWSTIAVPPPRGSAGRPHGMAPGTLGGLRPSGTRAVRRRPGPIPIGRRPTPRQAWATNAHRAGRGEPQGGLMGVPAPIGWDHRPDRLASASPEFEQNSDRAPPGGGAAPPSASPPREAGKVRRSFLRSSWVPRKGNGFPSPASSLRPLTGSGGVELDGLVP